MFTWSLEAAEGDCDPRHTLDFRPSVLGTQKGPCGRKAWQPPWGRKGGKEWRGLIPPGPLPSWKRWGWENIWPEHLVRT